MRVAITGGSGFIGGYLIQELLSQQCSVIALSRRPVTGTGHVQWLTGELGDLPTAKRLARSADAIVHAAVDRTGSFLDPIDNPLDYWHRNTTGSLQLIHEAANAGVSRFIFLSSGAVHDRVVGPLDEHHPMMPSTLYGAYKASVESLIHHYAACGRIVAANLRPTAVYGRADPIESSKWFDVTRDVVCGNDVTAIGGAKSVHAADVARAAWLLLSANEESISGQTFNCCDRMISEFEVASIAQSITGSKTKISGSAKQAKHEIDTRKIRSLGMKFGGTKLLGQTIADFVEYLRSR